MTATRGASSNILDLLLSPLYPGALAPEHRADLEKSGLVAATICLHRLMSVPPDLIAPLLGMRESALRAVQSAMLIPHPNPAGGWLPHSQVKVFPPLVTTSGRVIRYLQPSGTSPRLYFPLLTLDAVLSGNAPVWFVEGAKKSLAVAQLGLPSVGFGGVEGWHPKGARELLPDFDAIPLRGRVVEVLPDADAVMNRNVQRGVERFAAALVARGARPRLVALPRELAA